MAKRSETALRKAALIEDLRAAHRAAIAADGEAVGISNRELCARYELSTQTVSAVLQELVREGVLYTVPRVGTFMSRPRSANTELFTVLRSDMRPGSPEALLQSGFEERMAQVGGLSWMLQPEEASHYVHRGELAPLERAFLVCQHQEAELFKREGVAGVRVGMPCTELPQFDAVDFDNENGGHQAAQHLLQMGHRNIAFLGLHHPSDTDGPFTWSSQREAGWARAMQKAGCSTDALAFHPSIPPDIFTAQQWQAAKRLATEILSCSHISAVVLVNGIAASGFLHALRESGRPVQQWPALICFDVFDWDDSTMSCLQLPWEKLGAEAAQILWERREGRLCGHPVRRLVPMRLLPRLTCRPDWANFPLARRRILQTLDKRTVPEAGTPKAGLISASIDC